MGNSFGNFWKISTFGESHGEALGVIIDGCPAGVVFDEPYLLEELKRRRPGTDKKVVSDRQEADKPQILSGIFEGKTLGTPIAICIRNTDARSRDYKPDISRNGHADDMWREKFGHSDYRGGGRSSGRETVARVIAGALAHMFLRQINIDIQVTAAVIQIGPLKMALSNQDYLKLNSNPMNSEIRESVTHFPSATINGQAIELLRAAKTQGKSYGAEVAILISNVPQGLGQPVFKKLKADLASAMLGVGAVYAIEFGTPFSIESAEGSEFHNSATSTFYGGIRGGISTGEPILMRVKIKPTASVNDIAKQGRHDPCIAPRAIVVFESMAKLVIADHVLAARLDRVH